MRIAVTGVHGNIGRLLVRRGATPLDVDVTDYNAVRSVIKKASPDIVIHTASKSKPDWCEENTNKALDVNFGGSVNVATVCEEFNIPVVALSTDHVFTGKWTIQRMPFGAFGIIRSGPYPETYYKTFPVNFYGMTKLGMETGMDLFDHVKVVRTSNCFWRNDPRVRWYIDQLYKADKVPVPTFQHRSFMHRAHFVRSLEEYCERFHEMPKMLHISGSKTINWYVFIKAFAEAMEIPQTLIGKFVKKRVDEKFTAERPKKAGLKVNLSKRLGLPQFSYEDGLELLK